MAPLLSTKLYKPEISDNHIHRAPLLSRLLSDFKNGAQLSLVCAPAGYGKSTLVVELLNTLRTPSAWISLDEGDNDPHRFLSYLTAAFKIAGVNISDAIDFLVQDTSFNKSENILTLLLNTVSDSNMKIVLALDDYHVIKSQDIHHMVKFILDHQPQNLFLIMMTREDPQLPLARLRMIGRLSEYRQNDLVFGLSDIEELIKKATGLRLSSEAARKIHNRTEGWIASLQLACLLLKSCSDAEAENILNRFDGTNAYIIDYLVEEVLEHQTPEIREFLSKTSVLERMNGHLCDNITNRTDSGEILKQLRKANLFLISLDGHHEWYRYHHLFADSLKTSLCLEEERALYKRASAWMMSNGFPYEAVNYAFKSKDSDLVLRTIEDSVEDTFKYANLDLLVQWMKQLPDDVIRNSEALCVRKAIAYFATGRISEAVSYIETLDSDFEQHVTSHNRGLLNSIKAMIAGMSGKDAEPLAQDALRLLEPWDPIARISAMNTLGRAQFRKGKLSEAVETFSNAFESGKKLGFQFVTALALMNYSMSLHVTGRNEMALTLCLNYIASEENQFEKLPPYVGIIYAVMGELYADIHDNEKARHFRDEGSRLCKIISYDIVNTLSMFQINAEKSGDSKKSMYQGNHKKMMLEFNEKLSEREIEILSLIGQGLSNREIAQKLFISTNTTQWHITHIYSKLGVSRRTQAILKAKEMDLEV